MQHQHRLKHMITSIAHAMPRKHASMPMLDDRKITATDDLGLLDGAAKQSKPKQKDTTVDEVKIW